MIGCILCSTVRVGTVLCVHQVYDCIQALLVSTLFLCCIPHFVFVILCAGLVTVHVVLYLHILCCRLDKFEGWYIVDWYYLSVLETVFCVREYFPCVCSINCGFYGVISVYFGWNDSLQMEHCNPYWSPFLNEADSCIGGELGWSCRRFLSSLDAWA